MPLILDELQIKRLEKKRKAKRMKRVRAKAKPERSFRLRMEELWAEVLLPINERIKYAIRTNKSLDFIAVLIQRGLSDAEMRYNIAAEDLTALWSVALDSETRTSFEKALAGSLGVDIRLVLDDPTIKTALTLHTIETSQLITSIPTDYLGKVAKAVADNYYGVELPQGRTLMAEIQQIGKVSKKRASVISRDQTQKLTGRLNHLRQKSIGVEEYKWRTVKDTRVAGNPGGLYPPTPKMKGSHAHGNHYDREGKTYRWDDPPPDGHPGTAILCRCWAEPIVDLKKLIKNVQIS